MTNERHQPPPVGEDAHLGAAPGQDEFLSALAAHRSDFASGLSAYVHLPFCPSRCASCDHQASVTHEARDIDTYLDCLEGEADLIGAAAGRGHPLLHLHVGGGTPNYLADRQLFRLADILESLFTIGERCDSSIEINPARASASQLDMLRGLGFRRIQLEVRDLDPGVQRGIGRNLSLAMVDDVIAAARRSGFEAVELDLLYGLPGQDVQSMRGTVRSLLQLAPDRVNCSTFTRRVDRFPHQSALAASDAPSLADKLALFNEIAEGLSSQGYAWVGLECFARNGDALAIAQTEGRLLSNWLGYTTTHSSTLLGLGVSAISEVDGLCIQSSSDLTRWQRALRSGRLSIEGGMRLDQATRRTRSVMRELSCRLEVPSERIRSGVEALLPLEELARRGIVDLGPDVARVTPTGRLMLASLWKDASVRTRWNGVAWADYRAA
jgi:oxygen-independent coproporphyrinogen-3 oxidase